MKNSSLTIGIPIRNEAKSLQLLITSLINAVKTVQEALPELKIETLFCVNDTVDNSREIIEKLAFVHPLNSRLLESEPGKMNALIQIVQQGSYKNGMVCFVDADIELEKNCLLSLIRALESNKKVFLVYSSVRPKQIQKLSLLQKLQGIHYVLRKNVSPRKYFHGRTYLMRSTALLERDLRTTNEYPTWGLESGPCVDDIYLSRVIIHEYGLGSLKEVAEAKIYFSPPRTLRDFYLGQRRLCLEIKRLDLLYPEHAYVQTIYFKKKIRWSYFFDIRLRCFLQYLIYFLVEESVRVAIRLEIFLISLGLMHCKSIWKPLKTTKNGHAHKA